MAENALTLGPKFKTGGDGGERADGKRSDWEKGAFFLVFSASAG